MLHTPPCKQCTVACDPGTEVHFTAIEEGRVLEDYTFCCRVCFLEWIESEVLDKKVEIAKRDELGWLHDRVCPACKRRLLKCVTEGDVPGAS